MPSFSSWFITKHQHWKSGTSRSTLRAPTILKLPGNALLPTRQMSFNLYSNITTCISHCKEAGSLHPPSSLQINHQLEHCPTRFVPWIVGHGPNAPVCRIPQNRYHEPEEVVPLYDQDGSKHPSGGCGSTHDPSRRQVRSSAPHAAPSCA